MNKQQNLEELIIHHKKKYYTGDAEISDAEYDTLEEELRQIAPDSYVLQKVGFDFDVQKIKHVYPMLSLDKRRVPGEVIDWMDNETCMVSHKMDGSSASLVYDKGVFKLAKTRGDGVFGENITQYFKFIKIPNILLSEKLRSADVEIRGEVCISRKSFYELSEVMEQRKLDRPKSIRNIVAGLLHKKEDLDLSSYLDFIAYEIFSEGLDIASEDEKFKVLENEGFITPFHKIISSREDFDKIIEEYKIDLAEGSYLTDGLVIGVNNLKKQLARGFTAHHPKGKLAFKFKSETAIAIIENIVVDVGRTGKISFVGEITPVELSGATVRRVTLNNARYIEDNDINRGCEIELTRSGEVIPKHERTITKSGVYEFPSVCPACQTHLVRSSTNIDLICENLNCPARKKGRILNWITVTGIENLGPQTLERFFDLNLVTKIEDLYFLTPDMIENLEGLGKRSAEKITNNIAQTKKISFETFLTALGLDGLGKGVAKLIVAKYPSIENLKLEGNIDELKKIDGIGDILAANIMEGFENYAYELAENLKSAGVEIIDYVPEQKGDKLKGQKFVITGRLSKPRKEIEEFILNFGGEISSSVSKNTSYLLCNEPSESSKSRKAESLDIPIISEDDLIEMIK
ncbi:MAG: NAD-dependent DNA ligase LigA [Deltaproteobacteria bacterium]|nr:NAD-dependent DNA ligase LigA [Deltaproteobacteria bacterium]